MGMNERNELLDKQKINTQFIEHTISLSSFEPIVLDRENVGKRTLEYIRLCIRDVVKPNLTGYALALGTTPDGLNEWITDKRLTEETRGALMKGVSMIEATMISMMMDSNLNPVASIFLLKNHFGYKDQAEISFKGHIETASKSLEAKYKAVVDDD